LSLPLIALCGAPRHWAVCLPLFILVNELYFRLHFVDYFAYGGLAYELTRSPSSRTRLMGPVPQGLSLAATLLINMVFDESSLESGLGPFLLFLCFLPVAAGGSWFGLLHSSGARVAGAISYSLYLLNITVFFFLTRFWVYAGHQTVIMLLTETSFLASAVMISLLTYRHIERPFMARLTAAPGG
jgi:peptidoglycan/LPS O-acetylase OafA/YrhL